MLTELRIKNLPRPEKRKEIPDGKIPGLYLIHQPSDAKSWGMRYRLNGSTKLTLGPYPAIGLATARKLAQEARGKVAGGKDPAAAKRAARAAATAERKTEVDLVQRVVEQFIERYAKPNTRDWRETRRLLVNEVVSRFGAQRLSQITRAHVHEMLDEIVDRGAPVGANRVYAQFRKMCRWALSRGIIDHDPCAGVAAPTAETPRDRVLSDDEIRLASNAFEAIGWPFGQIGKLLLLTGARRDEVAGMRWDELDLADRMWTMPKERTKNRREHAIPLTDVAVRLIAGLPRIEGKEGFVFTTRGRSSVSGFSNAKDAIDRAILKALKDEAAARGGDPAAVTGPPPWVVHDIRRTVATNLQKLGVRLEVTEAVLNHVSGSRAGIVGVYQRFEYADEKRQALEAWARRLETIVSGGEASNVVELAKARG
jgi:integrase